MAQADCLFCRILASEIPSHVLYEDSEVMAFKDIHPKATTHVLFVPKTHVDSILTIDAKTKTLPGMLIFKAKEFAAEHDLPGYKLTFHVGREGGQIIDHLHLHLMSEQAMD